MTISRYRPPFWRRGEPPKNRDIAKLRPSSLPKGKRFETVQDARIESERSELLLKKVGARGRRLGGQLQACRDDARNCDKPHCPVCARSFRRWFTGQLLRIAAKDDKPAAVVTVLLETAPFNRLENLDFESHRAALRKKLLRSGLDRSVVIGGVEIAYKGRNIGWVLHINLVVIHPDEAGLKRFLKKFANSAIARPTLKSALVDSMEQLSYVLKFTTYHRPFKRRGASKAAPVPLNPALHYELVSWMSERSFKDYIVLFNARLGARSIKASPKVALATSRRR